MNGFKYRRILYFISIVILITVLVQAYWTYKNYQQEKNQLITDVQISLDQAVDSYYTRLARNNTLEYFSDSIPKDSIIMGVHLDQLISKMDTLNESLNKEVQLDSNKKISIIKSGITDNISIEINDKNPGYHHLLNDSVKIIKDPINLLTSKIVISFAEDSLSLGQIDSLLREDLKRKNIDLTYGLAYTNRWGEDQFIRKENIDDASLNARTSSSFIMPGCSIEMLYDNISITVLKRNLISLVISILLIASIIFCLVYLLRIIQRQKQLSEIKNDLISNITHEFKTPLATIGVALEAIQRFNKENDPEKSKKYAQLSSQEVEKLTIMVEKLLETATLDSNSLELNLEESDLVTMLKNASDVSEDLLKGKRISFASKETDCHYDLDPFHFENALNNIIDNAIKYGGDHIEVSLERNKGEVRIAIRDNGNSLTPQKASKIFEKFYRVPHGNTHDVKGFGIGLYYTRKIIEKHGGIISVNVKNGCLFEIILPL
jgi:two-component system phosphate regulon sensor histidine kinase PhoR